MLSTFPDRDDVEDLLSRDCGRPWCLGRVCGEVNTMDEKVTNR